LGLYRKKWRFDGRGVGPKMYAGKQAVKGLYQGLMDEERMLPEALYKDLKIRKKHRIITDYIASMSDRYAMSLYKEMYGKL
jgi:dGTPase